MMSDLSEVAAQRLVPMSGLADAARSQSQTFHGGCLQI